MMLLPLIVTAMAAGVTATTAPCPVDRICAWDAESVVRGLRTAGYRAERQVSPAGEPHIVSATSGNEFDIQFYVCDDDDRKVGCTMLMLTIFLPPAPYLTPVVANAFNSTTLFGMVYIGSTGRLEFQLPIATVGGLPQATFAEQLKWYEVADAHLREVVATAMAAPATPPVVQPSPQRRP